MPFTEDTTTEDFFKVGQRHDGCITIEISPEIKVVPF